MVTALLDICFCCKNFIKFLLLISAGFNLKISKNVLLKSVIILFSSKTTYPSEILSTISCNAIGVNLNRSNLNIPIVKHIIVTENAIGVAYIETLTLPILPSIFTTIGTKEPIINIIACFEKNPEFFIEYLNNFIKDIANNKYV